MNLNQVDINKLPADVRKTFKQLQVLHAEKKIQNRLKMISYLLSNVCGQILKRGPTTGTLQISLINWRRVK